MTGSRVGEESVSRKAGTGSGGWAAVCLKFISRALEDNPFRTEFPLGWQLPPFACHSPLHRKDRVFGRGTRSYSIDKFRLGLDYVRSEAPPFQS